MDHLPVSDQHLQPEIDVLRAKHPETQDLYREVCVLLFFRYGVTPTANKLYQLVKKGSMSAPAEALNRFWENLREKSRIRIEHPDLPQSLQDAAGEVVATIWQQAQTASAQGYLALRHDALASSSLAQANAKAAQELAATTQIRLNTTQSQLQSLGDQLTDSKAEFARAQGESSALQAQITTSINERKEMQEAHKRNQQSWVTELEQQRQISLVAQERGSSDMRRVLLDIDRERLTGAKLQKELLNLRVALSDQAQSHRQKLEDAQKESQALLLHQGELDAIVVQLRTQCVLRQEDIEKMRAMEKTRLAVSKPTPLNASRIRDKLRAHRSK
jgi:hypothetical protein